MNGSRKKSAKSQSQKKKAAPVRKVDLKFNDGPDPGMKVVFGIPTTGWIRFEFHATQAGLVIPTNWTNAISAPLGYDVADGRNQVVDYALGIEADWIFFIDHDVLLPSDTLIKLRKHMYMRKSPVVGGLYYTKSSEPEPLVYRGRGTGPDYDWDPGDTIWANGMGMGCTMIHMSLFRAMEKPYFESPRKVWYDEKTQQVMRASGTEDLYFLDRVMNEKIIEKTEEEWEIEDEKQPFIIDTSIFCQHIDLSTGKQYPMCRPTNDWQEVHSAVRARMNKKRARAGKKKVAARG